MRGKALSSKQQINRHVFLGVAYRPLPQVMSLGRMVKVSLGTRVMVSLGRMVIVSLGTRVNTTTPTHGQVRRTN